MRYKYSLNKVEKPLNATYTEEELTRLTTLNLREICQKEKLPVGAVFKSDRAFLIRTILKYRGARKKTFIEDYIADSFSHLLDIINKKLVFESSKEIKIPTRLTLYKNLEMDSHDNYFVHGENLREGSVLILNAEKEVCGILSLVFDKHKDKFVLHSKENLMIVEENLHKNYSLGFLSEKASKHLYEFYYGYEKRLISMKCRVVPISELHVLSIAPAMTSLVIDFGTSNSSVGAYLDEHYVNQKTKWDLLRKGITFNKINKIKFQEDEIIPTVISIRSCGEGEIVYRYGHDALHFSKTYGYNSPATTFFAIKRWVNDYEKYEDVSDEEGNTARVLRKDILKAYFEYIINVSCRQHKCKYEVLHITSPIKQKQQFLEMYKEILKGYEIIVDTALDESISVLYNSISNQIEKRNFEEREYYNALVIDCGGGTTDLTNCTYFIEDNQITYKLNLTTTYANGETNFGGNNITYRIFQFLKIAFSEYYTKRKIISIEDVFKTDVHDIYRYIDSNSHAETYNFLEELYENCEGIIPTKYYDFRNSPSEEYMKVRSNFYFLWNLAEKIKVDFFHATSVAQTSFHKYGLKVDVKSKKIAPEEIWRLNIYKDLKKHIFSKNITKETHELVLHTELPNIVITKEEITALIKGDIYNLIKRFIEPLYLKGELDGFHFIKLTGQTCKIDIFRDALKEFIPGRVIAAAKKEKTVDDFKLTCLEGAIKYQNSKAIGLIAPDLKNNAPITPYKLIAFTHKGEEVTMISSLEELPKSYGFVSRNIETESVILTLCDADGKALHNYPLATHINDFNPTDYVKTNEDYSQKIPQDDLDSIGENEIKIFTYAFEDKWGFHVLPLARRGENDDLLIGKELYLPFENDEWEANFFDGKR
ncbi:MAG: hypothetical protein FWE02_02740 [Defluviitaleaceae bacterium]|nr:hypothetical protein [Defluviitaleaceae bacterium]